MSRVTKNDKTQDLCVCNLFRWIGPALSKKRVRPFSRHWIEPAFRRLIFMVILSHIRQKFFRKKRKWNDNGKIWTESIGFCQQRKFAKDLTLKNSGSKQIIISPVKLDIELTRYYISNVNFSACEMARNF